MIKAVLIDDEKLAITALTSLINKYFDFVKIIGTATSLKEGKKAIIKYNPDLVFLDIEMSDGTGFNLLESFTKVDFKVIFVTAYSEYALRAIKSHVFDYLLKPVDIDDLEEALTKVRAEIQQKQSGRANYSTKLAIPTKNGCIYLEVNKIIRIEASGSYSKIYTADNQEFTISNNLKHFEKNLDPILFFRCHHSHIINLSKVKRIVNELGMAAVLDDGTHIDVSKRKKSDFHKHMTTHMTMNLS